MCGRGGIGRRAALRSLSRKRGGSSSLLDRTITFPEIVPPDIGMPAAPTSRRRGGIRANRVAVWPPIENARAGRHL